MCFFFFLDMFNMQYISFIQYMGTLYFKKVCKLPVKYKTVRQCKSPLPPIEQSVHVHEYFILDNRSYQINRVERRTIAPICFNDLYRSVVIGF